MNNTKHAAADNDDDTNNDAKLKSISRGQKKEKNKTRTELAKPTDMTISKGMPKRYICLH